MVTNSAIVRSGSQNIHARNWKSSTTMRTTAAHTAYTHESKLAAGRGSWGKLVESYAELNSCKYEAVIDAGKGWKAVRDTFEQAVFALRQEVETAEHIHFIGIDTWSPSSSKNAKVYCHVQWFNSIDCVKFSKTINLLGVRWKDIINYQKGQ